jgi:hypothetical protein
MKKEQYMIRYRARAIFLFSFVSLAVGCSKESTHATGSPPAISPTAANEFLLAAEPSGSKGVLELRKQAKDGEEVVVAGRVGGSTEPLVKGRAAFTVVDTSFIPCSEKEGDDCKTPWDYCCDSKEDLLRGTVMVKFVNEQGKTLEQDAGQLLGIQPLKSVVVCGRARRDQEGNLTVLATKLYVKP